jgi:leucyl aminopeptidase
MGSANPSRLITLEWNGNPSSKSPAIGLVGKGVTFDTGGYSLKTAGMEEMKMDMGGSAVVLGVIKALALRKSKSNVVGVIGSVENMVSANAQRPSDIVKSMSGQTIEVLNTDAEGRLVLADALWYCQEKYNVKKMINFATLTGAVIAALGNFYAGLFSNSDKLSDDLTKSGKKTDEKVWRFPLGKEYDELLNCDIADVKNITGTGGAGSITAAQFLKRFVKKDVEWAHLDIAGVTWLDKDQPLSKKGGTAFGVRLIDNYIYNNHEKK